MSSTPALSPSSSTATRPSSEDNEFRWNPRQKEALALLAGPARHVMLRGGSRPGKTFLLTIACIARALKAPETTHTILRFRFNHLLASVISDTFPKAMKLRFPGVAWNLNMRDWDVEFGNGSRILFGGRDTGDRVEKILGQEHSTIYLNECSQLTYDARNKSITRLAQKSSLRLKTYYDCNPPTVGHWTYRMFEQKVEPKSGEALANPANYASMMLNPGDNLRNLITGMGTAKDKGAHGRFEHHWLDAGQLEAMYVNDWVASTAVDAVADDMTRAWRAWHGAKETVAAMVRAERELGVRSKVNKALKQSRTFGGAGILIGDGAADPSRELVVDRIPKGGIKYLHALSRWELVSGPLCRDPVSEYFGEPEYYMLSTPTADAGVHIHPSRVVRLVGVEHLEASRQVDCWGYSVLQRVYEAVRNATASTQGLAALVQEAKIDVVKIEGLTEKSVNLGWRTAMLARLGLANQGKSISGMLLLDALEEYTQKQVSLADLPEVMMAFLEVCAGTAGMPLTRMLGKSPGGLGSDGSGEIRHYYDTCSSRQETDLRPPLTWLDRVLKRHAIGHEPASLDYRWVPL